MRMALESGLILYISSVEIVSFVVALVLVVLAYRGYGKSGSKTFLLAATGFGLLGAASLVEGLLYQFLGFTLDEAHAVRSTLTAIGLVVLIFSIYGTRGRDSPVESGKRGDSEPAGRVTVSHAAETGRLDVKGPVQPLVDTFVHHVAHQTGHL